MHFLIKDDARSDKEEKKIGRGRSREGYRSAKKSE